jgi:hypothetical protein
MSRTNRLNAADFASGEQGQNRGEMWPRFTPILGRQKGSQRMG